MRTVLLSLVLAAVAAASTAQAQPVGIPVLVNAYIERYFQTFPSLATQAGRHDFDRQFEDLSAARRADWLRFNRETLDRLNAVTRAPGLDDAAPERIRAAGRGRVARSAVRARGRGRRQEHERVRGELAGEARKTLGPKFDLRAFMDGMMRLGPVAARHYRQIP